MDNIIVFCETDECGLCDISLELVTKGRCLAAQLSCGIDAIVVGEHVGQYSSELFRYGADTVFCIEDARLKEYSTLPYVRVITALLKEQKPQIFLAGATNIGRDLAPRIAAELKCGITADCTDLQIADYTDAEGKTYENILYQIRPNFVGNQLTTIASPKHRPQMATIREGVMSKEPSEHPKQGKTVEINAANILKDEDFAVSIIERCIENKPCNLKDAKVVIAGGYGVGSRENFELLYKLAGLLHAEVGATRAAVDAGYADHSTMIGQTGLTVKPKLYIAVGISGQVQHTVGMDKADTVVSINIDADAPMNKFANYVIVGDARETVTKLIEQLSSKQ